MELHLYRMEFTSTIIATILLLIVTPWRMWMEVVCLLTLALTHGLTIYWYSSSFLFLLQPPLQLLASINPFFSRKEIILLARGRC
jgi:hypothetical protein